MVSPPEAHPPTLPPSVEEAYRRKCIQLKQRMNEVEEANDVSRIRVVRLQRAIEKMRLERAFLLEQLAKRTSTNVEDSEGSPSPPPTPKEKPLRTKRGHRKPSFLAELGDGRAGSTFIPQGPVTMSPSSDAFSHTHPEPNSLPSAPVRKRTSNSNGVNHSSPAPKRPRNAFDLYSIEKKEEITSNPEHQTDIENGTFDIERAVASGWRDINVQERAAWQTKFEIKKKEWDREKAATVSTAALQAPADPGGLTGDTPAARDEDVEMGDDLDSHSGGDGAGFTAVNRT